MRRRVIGTTQAVFERVPVTTLFVSSGVGFLVGSLIPSQPWALVVFYAFAIPYYLVALLAAGIATELGLTSYALPVAVALVLLADAVLAVTRFVTRRWSP